MQKFKNCHEIAQKFVSEIVVRKQDDPVDFIVTLVYHAMFYVKWPIIVYYLVLRNQVGKILDFLVD